MAREPYCRTPFFERLTSTGSEAFSLLIFLDGKKNCTGISFFYPYPKPFTLYPYTRKSGHTLCPRMKKSTSG